MKALFFVSGIFLTLTICAQNARSLVGKWNWIESSGGITGGVITPASENKKVKVEFSKKGIYKEWENDKLLYSKSYKIERVIRSGMEAPAELIKYGSKNDVKQMKISDRFEFKGKDTLILSQDCPDCYSGVYVRIKK